MSQRITVCCTGKGTHGRVQWPALLVDGDSIIELLVRKGRSGLPTNTPVNAEGEAYVGELMSFAMLPVESHRQPDGGWRWKCPKCRLDKPLSNDNLRKWVDSLLTRGDKVADISHIPR